MMKVLNLQELWKPTRLLWDSESTTEESDKDKMGRYGTKLQWNMMNMLDAVLEKQNLRKKFYSWQVQGYDGVQFT